MLCKQLKIILVEWFALTSFELSYSTSPFADVSSLIPQTRTFNYTSGVLNSIVLVRGGRTLTKTFNYTSGVISSIIEVVT